MPDFGLFNYWVVIVLMMAGLYVVMAHSNLVKKLIGLSVFQSAVIMFYISMGKVAGGTAPILPQVHGEVVHDPAVVYSNPVPHVLMLTAIVVGVATSALALSIVVRIHEAYGTIEELEIHEQQKGRE
jgi:multicomponent Na+:H+ antiporter subunit C